MLWHFEDKLKLTDTKTDMLTQFVLKFCSERTISTVQVVYNKKIINLKIKVNKKNEKEFNKIIK